MDKLEARLQKRMHVSLYALLFLTVLLGISILLEGCTDSCETRILYTYYEPVYKTHEDLRDDIRLTAPQPIHSAGKIYLKDNLLFVNEPGAGIHIINNTNPEAPQKKSFLKIDGNFDMAINGNYLYADNYSDLVVFDISDLTNITEIKRIENVFPGFYSFDLYYQNEDKGVLVSWEEKQEMAVDHSDCGSAQHPEPIVHLSEGIAVYASSDFMSSAKTLGTGSGPGVGGSMARFTINKGYLYTLNQEKIQPFDISVPANPQAKDPTSVGWDIETIFPYKDNLFIGSATGMYIVGLASPESPQIISAFRHAWSCDPVVVDDKYAYVTLRSGGACRAGVNVNELQVIDIQNLAQPFLVSSFPLTNPHGLGIDNETLFVCDGDDGLKVFDASNPMTISSRMLAHYKSINAFDVIPWNDVLVMIGSDGLFQYDYSDPNDIKLLSKIEITNAE